MPRPPQHEGDGFERATLSTPSLRAQRSNPESLRGDSLDCFVASLLAMTEWRRMGGVQFAFQIAGIHPHSRGIFCPSFALFLTLFSRVFQQEGAGKTGCRPAPMASVLNGCAMMHRGNTGEAGNARPSLRSGSTAYGALFPETNSFLPPSLRGLTIHQSRLGRCISAKA